MADPTVQTDPVQSARPVAEIRSSSVVSEPSRPARHAYVLPLTNLLATGYRQRPMPFHLLWTLPVNHRRMSAEITRRSVNADRTRHSTVRTDIITASGRLHVV